MPATRKRKAIEEDSGDGAVANPSSQRRSTRRTRHHDGLRKPGPAASLSPSAAAPVVPAPVPTMYDTDAKDDVDGDDDEMDVQSGEDEEEIAAAAVEAASQQSHGDGSGKNALAGSHPRGVQPLGNLLLGGVPSIRATCFGSLGRLFTDEQLLDFLRSYCTASDLITLSRVSRALYVLSNEEELWRGITLERWEGNFEFRQDWRNTYADMHRMEKWRKMQGLAPIENRSLAQADSEAEEEATADEPSWVREPLPAPFKVAGFYSDFIFQSFYCSHIDLMSCFGGGCSMEDMLNPNSGSAAVPSCDNIPRVHYSELTPERFQKEFAAPNRPVIITGLVESWPCFPKAAGHGHDATGRGWSVENWSKKYPNVAFKVGRYVMRWKNYLQYMTQVSTDESPLYLFDSRFGEKIPELLASYTVPEFFRKDYFALLEECGGGVSEGRSVPGETGRSSNSNATTPSSVSSSSSPSSSSSSSSAPWAPRPAYRWILVGPTRSGSTFHKDPNHTSAWNGLLSGIKKWIMYPPDWPPPGVFPSSNESEVTTPISVTEWFINHYQTHRQRLQEHEEKIKYERERKAWIEKQKQAASSSKHTKAESNGSSSQGSKADLPPPGPIEGTCRPGELIFIPNGWWHTALNLAPSFAVTQNYVDSHNLWNVVDFLERDEGEIERNTQLLQAFEHKMKEKYPKEWEGIEQKRIEKEIARAEAEEAAAAAKNKKKKSSLWERLTT